MLPGVGVLIPAIVSLFFDLAERHRGSPPGFADIGSFHKGTDFQGLSAGNRRDVSLEELHNLDQQSGRQPEVESYANIS
jgi:hypothetical protein